MSEYQHPLHDRAWTTGLVLLVVSLSGFGLALVFPPLQQQVFGWFLFHYLLAVGYFIGILISGRLRKGRTGLRLMFVFLLLSLISAYSLNREVNLFDSSVNWFCAVLLVAGLNYLSFAFFEQMPGWLKYVISFVAGCSLVVFVYLAIYLLPIYGFSTVASFILGISLHSFVPLLFCIYTVVLLRKTAKQSAIYGRIACCGAGVVIVALYIYCFAFSKAVTSMNSLYQRAYQEREFYPVWIKLARDLEPDMFTDKILKSDIVYKAPAQSNGWLWTTPSRRFDEQLLHDPLVTMGLFLSNRPEIPEEERIKLLEVLYDARHQTEERLWRGDDLKTVAVNNTVQLWPQLYLSYTQLDMTVANRHPANTWGGSSQEAIYTFHLPEGALVSSLSLWVDGKERKGLLTTRSKADSAYKTIVGIEKRDPSVVHWQEGNRVSVRVFPVMAGSTRHFRIGITAPIISRGQQLVYQPCYFRGPSAAGAREEVSVSFKQPPVNCKTSDLEKTDNLSYTRSGRYDTSWQIAFDKQTPSSAVFSFNNYSYQLQPLEQQRLPADIQDIYVDVNKEWSADEWNNIYELIKTRRVFVTPDGDGVTQVTSDNKDMLFKRLHQQQFSLFPFYAIPDKSKALVISKSTAESPLVKDLKGTDFGSRLIRDTGTFTPVRLFNLGSQLSPYMQTLKQARYFYYEQGSAEDLAKLLQHNVFTVSAENDNRIALDDAGLTITRVADTLTAGSVTAPDHLMRLFAYNHILQQAGRGLVTDKGFPDTLVKEAEEAYVVSPVSSLIVLETQKDYDRFDIKTSKNSLENASVHSKGAVPEPHEWALIVLVLLVLLLIKYKPRLSLNRF